MRRTNDAVSLYLKVEKPQTKDKFRGLLNKTIKKDLDVS